MAATPPLEPVAAIAAGTPQRQAEAGYAATARAVGALPSRGSWALDPAPADPPPVIEGLDGLLPGGEAGMVLPLVLAALRPDARRWLGEGRLARIAEGLSTSETALLGLLNAAPLPPASLGEAALWSGQRVPLRTAGRNGWAELFWRPDRERRPRRPTGQQADRGAFAIRLALPGTGRIECRGRLEDTRLDAVMETALPLPRALAAELAETFGGVLQRLGLAGSLTVRHTQQDRGT